IGFILLILIVPPVGIADFSSFQLFLIAFLILLAYSVLSKNKLHFDNVAFLILSMLYVSIGFHYLIEARFLEDGLRVLFFILILIWSTDSGAYFAGRSLGKHKLWPAISPKKTVEGAL